MGDSKNATSTTAGVLRPDELAKYADISRIACAEPLAPWVENYWCLKWDLPEGRNFVSSTLPHPACTISIERGHVREGVESVGPVVVTGVLTRRFDVTLASTGWVFGIKFRPGGFASLTNTSARLLRDVPVAAPTALEAATVRKLTTLTPELSEIDCASIADDALMRPTMVPEPDYQIVLRVIAEMLDNRSIVRVGQVEERCGIGTRRLQRLFERYVGVSPKWVLTRYRIHDVVSEFDGGYAGAITDLAARYGWFDQAHFTREFTDLIGVTPGAYQSVAAQASR